jgi:uncharacterized protein YbjT (DUF2867 family)
MVETVLVTGGTGFIGGCCIYELLRRGYRVHTTVRDCVKQHPTSAALTTILPGERRGDRR